MGQPGFFDLSRRCEGLDASGDPLVAIAAAVPFELFRGKLQRALVKGCLRKADGDRKSAAGRKSWDEVLIFKILVLQALYNLSDDGQEYQLRDRLSFMRFAGLCLEDAVPDAKTLWLYREALTHPSARITGQTAHQRPRSRQQDPLKSARAGRTCVRMPAQHGRNSCAPSASCGRLRRSGCKIWLTTCAVWSCSNGRQSSLPEAKGQKERLHQPKAGQGKSKMIRLLAQCKYQIAISAGN
jgi:hypothetical protein